ncbi:MAG: hypothetical protein IMF06_09370 [Proteobacteria bacterium]|nr:hypothetical protein [Pseudomonadota bacterium]
MAAVAMDSLEYAHQLEVAGMPREQAEVVARGFTSMFIHNFDSLVTRDYLDTRFTEFETRIDANIDKRFTEVDRRFVEMEVNMDRRFADFRLEVYGEIGNVRTDLAGFHSTQKLHSWMFALLIAGIFTPILQNLFS